MDNRSNDGHLPASVLDAQAALYDSELLATERRRYEDALRAFSERAGPGATVFVRAPGRVNLIGEHTDYNHGFVLPMALDKDTLLVVRPRSDTLVRLWNIEEERFPAHQFTIEREIPPGPLGDWGNYVKAAAQALAARSSVVRGMDILVSGAPPLGTPRAAGLSSSSALLVAAALAFTRLNGIVLDTVDFARMCSEAEWYVGTRGGIMDHFASVLGQRGHALLLDCRPRLDAGAGRAHYVMEPVRIPDGYNVIICNSGVQRQKTSSQYNVRVAECRLAVTLLKRSHPAITHLRDVSAEALALPHDDVLALIETLPERLTMREIDADTALRATLAALNTAFSAEQVFLPRARARHVVTENERVLTGVCALRAGDAAAFGALMNAAHESMSRDYDASCPEVDALARIARAVPGVLGARVTGAGWGGCVVALAAQSATGFAETVAPAYHAATGLRTDIFVCRSGPGASFVGDMP